MDDVFVSHSHQDEARALELVDKLKSWGISVYVDVQDKSLSQLPSKELADRLAEKLRGCHLLIFAFSEEALGSRWMPWELGLAHGVIGSVVLWPFTKSAMNARATQEYLHLYEALDPETETAMDRLKTIVTAARESSVRPAHISIAKDLGQITLAKVPEFNNPFVASEFIYKGPMLLYSAWLDTLFKAR